MKFCYLTSNFLKCVVMNIIVDFTTRMWEGREISKKINEILLFGFWYLHRGVSSNILP